MIEFANGEELVNVNENVVTVKEVNLGGTVDRVGINELHLVVTKIAIKTPEEYQVAMSALKTVNALLKSTDDTYEAKVKDIKAAVKRIQDHFKKPMEILAAMKITLKAKITIFDTYLEHERIKQQEALRLKAQQDAKKLADRAVKAEASGKAEKAQALQEQAAMVANNVPVVDNAIKTEGAHYTKKYRYVIEDESKIPEVYWQLNEVMVGKQVRASEGKQIIPGIRIISEKVLATR